MTRRNPKETPMPDSHTITTTITGATTVIAWAALTPSPLNSRRAFPADAIAELAQSIGTHGLLQNLVVRRIPGSQPGAGGDGPAGDIKYEILAGERRWRAVKHLIDSGAADPADGLPVNVVDADDLAALEIILIENSQRTDLHPLEEGATYLAIAARGGAAADIAARIGKTTRHVELRIQIARDLVPEAQEKFRAGEIILAQARALAAAPAARQTAILEKMAKETWRDWDAADVKNALTDGLPRTSWALFDRALYDGAIVADPDDPKVEYFADTRQFTRLNMKVVNARKAKLESQWAWVTVTRGWFAAWNYDESKDKTKAGAVLAISKEWKITVHAGLVKKAGRGTGREGKPSPEAVAAKKAAPLISDDHFHHAARRKAHALETAIAKDTRLCKALFVVAVVNRNGYALGLEVGAAYGARPAPAVAALLKPWQSAKPVAATLKAVLALSPAKLDALFGAAMAASLDWDDDIGAALAGLAGVAGKEAAHGLALAAADLDGLSPAVLAVVYKSVTGWEPTSINKLPADILARAKKDYVLPTLRFVPPADAVKALTPKPEKPAGEGKANKAEKPAGEAKAKAEKPAAKKAAPKKPAKKAPAKKIVKRGVKK
jgi:ParB/RepB/Spo0J family partition protein